MQESSAWNEGSKIDPAALNPRNIPLRSIGELEDLASRKDGPAIEWQVWQTLHTFAVGRMNDAGLSAETRLRWVRLALTALKRKGENSEPDTAAALSVEAYIRAYAIREFGAMQDGGIRDPADLCNSVFREIGIARAEVHAQTTDWHTRPVPEILHLRRIKNMLTPLRDLEGVIPVNDPARDELSAWLPLIHDLP
ncbi:hypothetical protein [Streptomyces sp. SP18BB07]|uniref:hypothetical protein n=1 Tax=Streptomyces sp. SP18BB07 TaxID=3002522 RepID=UPI002E787F09|nr:hypothetical protein [Streptomyces sp. SP18BB07]MEE1766327.1 hypothetical protein [Streptomyces sp. SP18BB07]